MKADTHPETRYVIFQDNSSKQSFLIASTIKTDQEGTYEGKKYPLVEVEISSASHPFYTGETKVMDTAGRVERFKQRQSKTAPKTAKPKAAKAAKEE